MHMYTTTKGSFLGVIISEMPTHPANCHFNGSPSGRSRTMEEGGSYIMMHEEEEGSLTLRSERLVSIFCAEMTNALEYSG